MGEIDDLFDERSLAKDFEDIKDLAAALEIDAGAERKKQEIEERYKRDREELLAEKIKEVVDERAPNNDWDGPKPPIGANQWPTNSIEREAGRRVEQDKRREIEAAQEERERGLNDLREPEAQRTVDFFAAPTTEEDRRGREEAARTREEREARRERQRDDKDIEHDL